LEVMRRVIVLWLALAPTVALADVPSRPDGCAAVRPGQVTLTISEPKTVEPNAPVSIRVAVSDALRLVDRIDLHFRKKGEADWSRVSAVADEQVSLVLSALAVPPAAESYDIEYRVSAVGACGDVLAEAGPRSFQVAAGEPGEVTDTCQLCAVYVTIGLFAAGLVACFVVAFD
jgi:hypothetical protein